MAIREGLLADFDHEMGTTRRLLDRLPDEKLSWKPHAKSMSLGALGTHLSDIPQWGQIILSTAAFDLADAPPGREERASRAAILDAFDEATKKTRALMDKTDAEYEAVWTLNRGGHQVFSLPRGAAFRTFVIHHVIHHRGQLSVYLRLIDVPVPAVYGPTADEGA